MVLGCSSRFPELFECIDPMDPDASKIAESLTEMLKRHGETVLQVMEEQISLVTSELARESLPKDCLIRLISGSSQTMGQDTGSLGNKRDGRPGEGDEDNSQKEVRSDSLQSPHDPEATYSGHKGKGYEVQVAPPRKLSLMKQIYKMTRLGEQIGDNFRHSDDYSPAPCGPVAR